MNKAILEYIGFSLAYTLRGLPEQAFNIVSKQVKTELQLSNEHPIYQDFLSWLSVVKMNKYVRSLSVDAIPRNVDEDYGGTELDPNEVIKLSIGFGNHYFWFNKVLVVVSRSSEKVNSTAKVENVSITAYARDHDIFRQLLAEVANWARREKKLHIFSWKDHYWQKTIAYKRPIETVVIDEKAKQLVVSSIRSFFSNKDWYIKNGIPWRLGIILSGPPGTGKTSFIKALCTEFEMPLYNIGSDQILSAHNALSYAPERSVIAIEDIDAIVTAKRTTKKTTLTESDVKSLQQLAVILNAIDGVSTPEGRVLIATTNHIAALDEALIRPGRFDLKVELGYMTNVMMHEYLKRFYPDSDFSQYRVKPQVAACQAQALVWQHPDDLQAVLAEIAIQG